MHTFRHDKIPFLNMITTEAQPHYMLTLETAVLQQDTDKRPRSYLAAGSKSTLICLSASRCNTCYQAILKNGIGWKLSLGGNHVSERGII